MGKAGEGRKVRVSSSSPSIGKSNRQEGNRNATGSKVFVGNLSYETTWQELKDHMKTVGHVAHADIAAHDSGRSKGFGIVEYSSAGDAQRAIDILHNTELNGRPIYVREDRDNDNTASKLDRNHVASGVLNVSKQVYVGNLSWEVAWQDLKDHMKTVGEVIRADIMTDHTGRSKGCGLVEFATQEGANAAINVLHDTELKGRKIFIREDRERTNDDGGASGSSRLYVGNLDYSTEWYQLKDHFKQCGHVTRADVAMEEGHAHRSKGFGIVEFSSKEEALRAVEELNDSTLNGRQIFVREDRESKRRY